MLKQVFINVPVKDLEKTKAFWTALGFSFNPQFTDSTAACLLLGENIFAMLLTYETMKRFTKKTIADATQTTEAINALGGESREEVDTIVTKAIAAGGKETRPAEDVGWMYSRSFEDLDGHQWEVLYGDMSKLPAKQ